MSSEINQRVEEYIFREKALLDQLTLVKSQKDDASTKLVTQGISYGVGEFASWLFESSRVRRYGRSLSKKYLDQQLKEQKLIQERTIEHQHNVTVQSLRTFLSTISIWNKTLKEQNSKLILAKLDKAQTYVRLSTKIRNTIKMLIDLSTKGLVYNTDILQEQLPMEVIISPGKPYSGMLEIKKILSSTEKFVYIIDTYVDIHTLDLLLTIPEGIPIKVITAYTGGQEKERRLIRACRKFKQERPMFDLRKCDPSLIHDRFILSGSSGWNIGASLKDVGKGLSMITLLNSSNRKRILEFFTDLWKDSMSFKI